MKNKIYCIYDKVAQEGSELMLAKNDDVASRIFKNVLEKEIKNGASTSDYALYCIGIYDTEKPCLYTQELIVNGDIKEYKDVSHIVPITISEGDVE